MANMFLFWLPFVHDPCTFGFFCPLYKFCFLLIKKKKKMLGDGE